MKKISLVLISLFVVLSFAGSAMAVNTNTGEFIDKYPDNDSVSSLQTIVDNDKRFSGFSDIFQIHRIDDPHGTSGNWSSLQNLVYFYVVKAGNDNQDKDNKKQDKDNKENKENTNTGNEGGFELYWVENGALAINWENQYLKNNNDILLDVSHVTFYGATKISSVPIPASIFLLVPGLLGVVGLSRRRKK